MRTGTESSDLLPLHAHRPTVGAKMITIEEQETPMINRNSDRKDDHPVDDDEEDFPEEFFPTDSEADSSRFDDHDENDEVFLDRHLHRSQLRSLHRQEEEQYHRAKRSAKKIKAQRQIKSKHARSIQYNSHNQHLYIHHRLAKRIVLSPARKHYLASPPSVPLYTPDALRGIVQYYRNLGRSHVTSYASRNSHRFKFSPETYIEESLHGHPVHDYAINEFHLPNDPTFDEEMVRFLLDMQNRDLSPEDYEMLLRLDDRVQRKTVQSNVFESLPTIIADQRYLDNQCSICMETYQLDQQLKRLPCEHFFHSNCIETYLKSFSNQCPLDNLPLI